MTSYSPLSLSRLQEHIRSTLFPWGGHKALGIGFLLAGVCAGVAVRAGMLWFVDVRSDAGDAVGYLNAARNLLEYSIYSLDENSAPVPGFYRPPLYSFFVALVTGTFGRNLLALQIAQIVVSLVSALLATRIAARYAPAAAPWVFGLMLLSPFEAVYTAVAMSEALTAFLLVASAYALLMLEGSKRWSIGGVLLGLCALARDIYLPLSMAVAFAWLVFGKGAKASRVADAAILVICSCLVVLPWTLRNYLVADRFVPVSEGRLGFSLWVGTWATNTEFTRRDAEGQRVYPPEAYRNQEEKSRMDEALAQFDQGRGREADFAFRRLASQRMHDEPLAVLGRYIVRAPKLWFGTRFDLFQLNANWFPRGSRSWTAVKVALWGLNALFTLLCFAGIVITFSRRNPIAILVLPIVYTALIYFPLNSFEIRYSLPVYPFVLVFAGIAAAWFIDKAGAAAKQ